MNLKDACDHHLFDVTGKSPLMTSYLDRNIKHSHVVANRVLIGRTELLPQAPRRDPVTLAGMTGSGIEALTYAQFVSKQFRDTRRVLKDVSVKETEFNKEIADMWKATTAEMRDADEKLQLLLTNNEQVKKLSNLLMLEIMTEPSQRTTTASRAIRDALNAIETNRNEMPTASMEAHSLSNSSLLIGKSLDAVAEKNYPDKDDVLPPIFQ